MQANASLLAEGEKTGLGSIRAGAEANYGRSTVDDESETTVKNGTAFVNVKKTITPRTFSYLEASARYDDIAKIDYRIKVSPGLGVYFVKNDRFTFLTEAGPAFVIEKVDEVSSDYLALRIAERTEYKINHRAKFWQALEYLPKIEDFGEYLLTFEAGVESALTDRLNLRLVLQDNYDSTPADDAGKNDITLIGGLSVSL